MPGKQRDARRWLAEFAGLLCLMLVGLLFFNIHYDPYLVLSRSDAFPKEMNGARIALSSYSYFSKATQIIREKPDTILLGTSVTDGGFRTPGATVNYFMPDENAYLRLKNKIAPHSEIYNAALRGKHLAEEYEYLQHAYLNNPHLKEVYLGIDWTIFTGGSQNESLKPEVSILGTTEVTDTFLLQHLMSWSATQGSWLMWRSAHNVKDSFHALTHHLFERHHHQAKSSGAPDDLRPMSGQNAVLKSDYTLQADEFAFTAWFVYGLKASIGEQTPETLSYEAFNSLKKIIAFCDAHHIRLKVFLTPKHPLYYAFMDHFGLTAYEEEWLKKLTELAPVWDFTGAIDFSPHPENYFMTDSLHFAPAAGEIILPELLKKTPSLPGTAIMTPRNVDTVIAAHRAEYADWQKDHAELMAGIQGITLQQVAAATAGQNYLALMPVVYEPDYKGFRVFRFMGEWFGVPVKAADKPLLTQILQYAKQHWPASGDLSKLIKLIDQEEYHAV